MPPASPKPARPAGHRLALRAVLLVAAVGYGVGCGKKGPPLPPLRIQPRPPQAVQVRQIGPEVLVTASVSPTRTDGSPLGSGASAEILKMRAAPTLKAEGVSARYLMTLFQKDARMIASVEGVDLQNALAAGRILYHDRVAAGPETGGGPAPRYFYAVQIVDERKERSPLSAPQEIQVEAPTASPVDLKAETGEGEIRLSWSSGRTESKGLLYNVYRRTASETEEPLVPLNPQPLSTTAFIDTRFQYGETYRYSVRTLERATAPVRESVGSAEMEIRPLDVYAPKAPSGLAAAVEGRVIKLYWFPNSESDLRGYRVYRREEKGEFAKIGEADASEPSYADTSASRGVRYYYSVSAFDGAEPPNESARSDAVSEVLPADASGAPGSTGRRR